MRKCENYLRINAPNPTKIRLAQPVEKSTALPIWFRGRVGSQEVKKEGEGGKEKEGKRKGQERRKGRKEGMVQAGALLLRFSPRTATDASFPLGGINVLDLYGSAHNQPNIWRRVSFRCDQSCAITSLLCGPLKNTIN